MTWKSSLLLLVFVFLPLTSTNAVGAIEDVDNNGVEIIDGEVDREGNAIGEEDVSSTYGPWEDADATTTAAVEVTTERQFETLGLKNHYEIWMKMILQSDYVKNNGSVNYNDTQDEEEDVKGADKQVNDVRKGTKGVDEEAKGEDNEANTLNKEANGIADEVREASGGEEVATAATSANNRLRILQKLVYSDHRIIDPVPTRVSTKCECGLFNSPRQKIVGGTETYEHHYPWMVSLQLAKNKKHFCGASIISDTYILTAAHCTDGLFAPDLLVRVGDHDLTRRDVSREYSIPVYQIHQHPGYNRITTDNDISLMRVKEPLVLTWRINPICLTPPDLTFYKESVVVMGWGKESEKADLGSPRLKHVDLQILPMGKCRHNFKFLSEEITSNMLCALLGTKDTCQGDSGGPLTWYDEENRRYFLIGVTSWGIGCGLPNYPGVYTKVGKYLDWIYDTTGDSTFCTSYHPQADVKKVKQKPKIYKLDDFMLPDLDRPWKRRGSRGKKRKKKGRRNMKRHGRRNMKRHGRRNMKRHGRWDLKKMRYGNQKRRGEMGNGKWKKTQIRDGKSLLKKAQRKYPGKERQEKASKKLRKRKKVRKGKSRLRNIQGKDSTWEKWQGKMEKKRRKQEHLKKGKSKLRKAQEKYSAQKKRQEETGERRRKQQKTLKEGKSKTRKIHRQHRLRNRSKDPKRRKKKRRRKKKKSDDKSPQLACSKTTKRKRNRKRPNSLQEESQEKD